MYTIRRLGTVAAICLLSGFGARAAAQAIVIEAVSAPNDPPVGVVSIGVLDERGKFVSAAVASDSMGRATIPLPAAGRYRVLVRRLGFRADTSPLLRVAAGQTITRRAEMHAIPHTLEKVDVKDELKTPGNLQAREFEFRKRTIQVGRVYTKRDLDSLNFVNLKEAVNDAPGAEVSISKDFVAKWVGPFCGSAAVFWNGLHLRDPQALSFVLDIDLKWVTALEVYSTKGSVPMDYNVRGACAVVAVWTKKGIVR